MGNFDEQHWGFSISGINGRVETRTVKLVAVTAGFEFPHAALTIQITLTL